MAKIIIKSSSSNEDYEVTIDDIFVQKAKDLKELNSFIKTVIELTEAQSKQKALNILDKESQSFINKFTTVLNGITEAIKVIQTCNKIVVGSDSSIIDNRTDEQVEKDIDENFVWAENK